MSEFEDRLNGILSSPKDMEKIMSLAKSISGGAGEEKSGETGAGGIDPRMLGMLAKVMRDYSSGEEDGKLEILRAMKPYIRRERQESLKKAMEVARMARLAKIAMTEFSGGSGDV